MDLFQQTKPRYILPKRPKLFESFAGVGMQRMGFKRLGIEYEMVGISEIDKHAIQSYMAIHGPTDNYGDITKIKGEDLPQIDVFTYSFPCQDLSVAGKGKGMKEGTRSGLVFEVIRILRELKETDRMPGLLIMENVTAILNKKHIEGFEQIKRELEELGYTNYVDKLNAKKYGVAQNRDRAWMISVLGDYYYEFPKPIPLEKRLKDYLEDEVDEKYYLSDKMLACFTDMTDRNGLVRGDRFNPHDIDKSNYAFAITTLAGNRATDNFIKIPENTIKGYSETYDGDGVYINRPHQKRGFVQEGMIQTLKTSGTDVGVVVNAKQKLCDAMLENGNLDKYDMIRHSYTNERMENLDRKESTDGISAALTTRPDTLGVVVPIRIGGLYDDEKGKHSYSIKDHSFTIPSNPMSDRGQMLIEPTYLGVGHHPTSKKLEFDGWKDKECPTLLATDYKAPKTVAYENPLRIRKLTPLECWRLMGIDDEDFHKAKASGVSNSQLYKQAGNGLVVDMFAALLSTMIDTQEVSIEMEETMTVKELIEILTWCDEDKPVRIAIGNNQVEIEKANEEDDCIVLVAS